MKLHTAGEDYLEAVFILQKKLGMVRSVDVARYMEVSKPSVCYAVGTLREGGFLTTDFFVDVTEEVMETIRAAERAEAAYERKMYRYKAGNASGGKTASGAGLCCCDEAAGETGKEDLCPILSGNDGK